MKTAATGLRATMRRNAICKQMGSRDLDVVGQRVADLTTRAIMALHAQHPVWSMVDGALPVLGALGGLGAWCGWRHLCAVTQSPTPATGIAIAHAGLGATVAAAALHALLRDPMPVDLLPGGVLPIMQMGRMQVAISSASHVMRGQVMCAVPLRAGGTWCIWPQAAERMAPVVPQVHLEPDLWQGPDPVMRLSVQVSMDDRQRASAHLDVGHEDGPWSTPTWKPESMPLTHI